MRTRASASRSASGSSTSSRIGILDDRGGDRDEGRLAGRQSARRPVEQSGHAHPLRDFRHPGADDHRRDAAQLECEPDLVPHALGRERLSRMLQHDAHPLREVARGHGIALVSTTRSDPAIQPPSVCE